MSKKTVFWILLFAALGLVLLFILGTKKLQFAAMAEAGKRMAPMPESVSTFVAAQQTWGESLRAIGSIEPIQGVELKAEIAGLVTAISFENGQSVQAGDLLVQLDVDVERAQLRATEATAKLARVEYERAKKLRASGSVPQSQLDRALAELDKMTADVDNFKAIISRKTIRAPFSGQVGIRQVNLGQYVAQGAPIVTLQAYDKVFVNFTLPQQALAKVDTGMAITLSSDVNPDQPFAGTLTAISPQVDPTTRTITLQGTLDNPDGHLRAGLFVRVTVTLPEQHVVLVVPSTAIVYAPYGNSIYKIEQQSDASTGESHTIAKQFFIRIGKRTGDFVSILKGLEVGDEVVSAGAFKLRNGIQVNINNDMAPTPELAPEPDNS
jgi:membrane fusion protein (multidrug efflux system)